MPKSNDVAVTGYGSTAVRDPLAENFQYPDSLQQAFLSVLDNSSCHKGIKNINEIYANAGHRIIVKYTDRMLCARGLGDENISDSCQGDSGGPLVKNVVSGNGSTCWTQTGIVSWGFGCASRAKDGEFLPGYYVNVASLIEWVLDKMGIPKVDKPVVCQNPLPPKNGFLTGNARNYLVGSLTRLECDEGYTLKGKNTSKCNSNGEWEPFGTCQGIWNDWAAWSPCSTTCGPGIKGRTRVCIAANCTGPDQEKVGCTFVDCIPGSVMMSGSSFSLKGCPAVSPPIHGAMTVIPGPDDKFLVGTVVSFSCDDGWRLKDGPPLITCQTTETWSDERMPVCEEIVCKTPQTLPNGKVFGDQFKLWSTRRFACNPGYVLRGSRISHCNALGQWTGKPRNCEKILCPRPKPPANAEIVGDNYASGNSIQFICNEGFSLVGSGFSICGLQGAWSAFPTCTAKVKCPVPKAPTNAIMVGNRREIGSIMFFSCNGGFYLQGTNSSTCRPDGKWERFPTCRVTNCADLEPPENGKMSTTDSKVGSSVTFRCNHGFRLEGGSRISHCNKLGQWTGKPRSCEQILCPRPKPPANAEIVGDNYAFGNSIQFICNEGFSLVGSGFSICGLQGEWTAFPTCAAKVKCPEAKAPTNAIMVGHKREVGSIMFFSCDGGFYLQGEKSSTCLPDGNWQIFPKCKEILCPKPKPPANAEIVGENYASGNSIKFICNEGFSLVGSGFSICGLHGEWTAFPTCAAKVKCPDPKAPTNAIMVGNRREVGSILFFSCNGGFYLQGTNSSTCLPDGNWERFPKCKVASCEEPQKPVNGYITYDSFLVGSRVNFICDDDFLLVGNDYAICNEAGEWGPTPKCRVTKCADLEPPENGKISTTVSKVGSRVTFWCDHGFRLEGMRSSICDENGKWGAKPSCKAVFCPTPKPPANGAIIGKKYTSGGLIRFRCIEGYSISGLGFSICSTRGEWSEFSTCIADAKCPEPIAPRNGRVTGNKRKIGSTILFSCNDGYDMEGINTSRCLQDGTWQKFPNCRVQRCDAPQLLKNGYLFTTSITLGSRVEFICNDGFTLIGKRFGICNEEREWGPIPHCKVSRCPDPDIPVNGHASLTNNKIGSRVSFWCNSGFRLEGKDFTICDKDGKWDPTPQCKAIRCPVPVAPVNGMIYGAHRAIGSRIYFQCNDDYVMDGEDYSVCDETGTWGPVPKCEVVLVPTLPGGVFIDPTSCDTPPEPENGYIEEPKDTYLTGEYVIFQCESGFQIQGEYWTQCLGSNLYLNQSPICTSRTSCISGCTFIEEASCQCDSNCLFAGNCCTDYFVFCRSSFP